MQQKTIGIMNEAYFVGRKELLAWLNTFFAFNYDKIEQVCTGAAHCQIMDALYPGQVPLSKVNFFAKYDYEYIKNYKILQEVFNKLNISKIIDVNRLIKGKYQDNLEFLQWMKRYFDLQWDGKEYDAVGRRKAAIKEYDQRSTTGTQSGVNMRLTSVPQPSTGVIRKNPPSVASTTTGPIFRPATQPSQQDENSTNKIRQLGLQNTQLRQEVQSLEKEMDFYFQKLRDIEVLCEGFETSDGTKPPEALNLVDQIKKILYATEEDFVSIA